MPKATVRTPKRCCSRDCPRASLMVFPDCRAPHGANQLTFTKRNIRFGTYLEAHTNGHHVLCGSVLRSSSSSYRYRPVTGTARRSWIQRIAVVVPKQPCTAHCAEY